MNLTHNQTEYLLSGLRKLDAPYPPELLAARRECFKYQIAERQPVAPWTTDLLGCDDVTSEIAVNVAAYNVAHVSEKNKAWAERRLQEELEKEARRNR
jgi:hypothetical protein